ncbi:MAG TPA: dihydrodipicolinate synthase family protein, partial [Terriglobales bacterium]|nr:dihydrodipicolinate synthase family protein [Terriglobales bacterium]
EDSVDGFCIGGLLSGTAGALPEELCALTASVRRASQKPLFAMIFPDVTVEAFEMTRAVADGGAKAILVAEPHYLCQPDECGLVEMFAELRKSVSCSLLFADCFAEARIATKTITNLIAKRLVDGVFEAADAHSLVDLLALHPNVPVYSGIEDLHYVAFMLGAHGAISDLGTVFPRELGRVYRSVQNHEHQDARFEHERLVRLWRVLSSRTQSEARLRSALGALNRKTGVARSPQSALPNEVGHEIAATLRREGLLRAPLA